ncbi:MAG TPA: TIGR02466 family protein, partial [Rhizomicrobium sp.]
NDLPRRHPAFEALRKILDRHVAAFARGVEFDLAGRKLVLDSMWINILEKNGVHAPHIHPHSVLSGACYVQTPKDSGDIRFEDPRLGLMMAAPARRKSAKLENRLFVSLAPRNGDVLLWESWLRHGVEMQEARQNRISISFNYRLN